MSHSRVVDGRFTALPEFGVLAPIGVPQEKRQHCTLIIHPDAVAHALFSFYLQRLSLVQDVVPQFSMSPEEGLLLLRRQAFDLVLLSTESWRESLESIARRVKAASRHPSVALVGIRFPDPGEGRERHLRAGFTDFLAAPPSFKDFARVVGARLTSPRSRA